MSEPVRAATPKSLVGYSDRLSVSPGDTLRFMVSCDAERYGADLVRLYHGDTNPEGPGFVEEPIKALAREHHPGQRKEIYPGSYGIVSNVEALVSPTSISIAVFVLLTTLGDRSQTFISNQQTETEPDGFTLGVDSEGRLTMRLGDETVILASGKLRPCIWYFVAASFDSTTRLMMLYRRALESTPLDEREFVEEARIVTSPRVGSTRPLTFGARLNQNGVALGCLNGRLERPRLFAQSLDVVAARQLVDGRLPLRPIGDWDLSAGIGSSLMIDVSGAGLDGRLINMPARAVTGHLWNGREQCWRHASEQYGAVHFHDDDLEDALWSVDFEWRVPAGLPCGVYAARLGAETEVDHVPFIVRPRRGRPTAHTAVLMPTLTYLAYGNHAITDEHVVLSRSQEDEYIAEHRLVSQYNRHSDRSGVFYASRLRPLLNLRPRYRYWLTGHPHGLGADLSLLEWLRVTGRQHDLITDEDLHREGADLLRQYRVLLTGSHPEYWTEPMMTALQLYRDAGGRVMYLGGNGFCWVTGIDLERPHVTEVRREHVSLGGLGEVGPGEMYLSSTGEPGGLWASRHPRARTLVGVDYALTSLERGRPYRRLPDGDDPRASFIFRGLSPTEPIGDSGLLFGGAAGEEVDCADYAAGTPPHALVVASATDLPAFNPAYARADMVFFETDNGGAVFSVSSIAWCGALPCQGFRNGVATVTANVFDRFTDPQPFIPSGANDHRNPLDVITKTADLRVAGGEAID